MYQYAGFKINNFTQKILFYYIKVVTFFRFLEYVGGKNDTLYKKKWYMI